MTRWADCYCPVAGGALTGAMVVVVGIVAGAVDGIGTAAIVVG